MTDFESKIERITAFFRDAAAAYNTLVIISRDESDDVSAANESIRRLEGLDCNIIFCVGAESPIVITPKSGIALQSRTLLLVDEVPETWLNKENVVVFEAPAAAPVAESLVKVNKIE